MIHTAWGKAKSSLSADELQIENDRQKEDTESQLKDKIFNSIVDRYTRNGREFTFSDKFVWKGAVYVIPETVSYMLFFGVFLTLAMLSFKRYGEARTIVFVMLLMMWRVQVIIKLLHKKL